MGICSLGGPAVPNVDWSLDSTVMTEVVFHGISDHLMIKKHKEYLTKDLLDIKDVFCACVVHGRVGLMIINFLITVESLT